MSGIWMYRIHCHHSYFFILEVVVFTEERHRWDKYDQNHVGSQAADGCSVGRSWLRAFCVFCFMWCIMGELLVILNLNPCCVDGMFSFQWRYSRDKALHCCVYEFWVYVHSCVTVIFIHQYCFQSKMYGNSFLSIFLSHSDEVSRKFQFSRKVHFTLFEETFPII